MAPKTQAARKMLARYKNVPVGKRMNIALELAMTPGGDSQSQIARDLGVTRSRLSERIKLEREKRAEQQARSELSAAERRQEAPNSSVPARVEDFGQRQDRGDELPEFGATMGEVRRVPPFVEFDKMYFSGQICFDCGVNHETPPFHIEMMEAITDPSIKRLMINLAAGHAKSSIATVKSTIYELAKDPNALALDTPIPTPGGWTTMGEVAVGDTVFDRTGAQTSVVAKSPVFHGHDCYRVILSDGSTFTADAGHRWYVNDVSGGGLRFRTTQEMFDRGMARGVGYKFLIPNQPGLDLPEADLPIDPYVLGAWLGDGTAKDGTMACHPDDMPETRASFEAAGFPTTGQGQPMVFGTLGLKVKLRELGVLSNKHIPAAYHRGSFEQRLALIQGLMDTDGCATKRSGAQFANTNVELVIGVMDLAASLGYKPSLMKATRSWRSTMDLHTVYFRPIPEANPFRLSRKAARVNPDTNRRSRSRTIVDIYPVASVPTQCLQVASPTETFLAGHACVPTGNSMTVIISKTKPLAAKFLYQIKNYLTNELVYANTPGNLIQDWGPFAGGEAWTKDGFYVAGRQSVEKDPTVSAYGVGMQILGSRAHHIKLDDIADLENSSTAERVRGMMDWITAEPGSRVGRHGKLTFIGTRVSPQDIYSHLELLPAYKVIRYPTILDEDAQITLWPEHFPYEAAVTMRESMSAEKWQLLWQNVATPGFGASFTPEIVESCYDPERSLGQYDQNWALVGGLDPAGAGPQGGYSAFTLIGVDLETGAQHLVDLVNVKQMKAPQMKDQLFDWADRYPQLREFRVEGNGLQSQLVQYNTEIMSRLTSRGIRLVNHVTNGRNKWDADFGVESMATMFINRQMSIPTKTIADRTRVKPFVEQLVSFPMGHINDLVMSFWFAHLGAKDIMQRAAIPMFDPRFKAPKRILRQRRTIDFGAGTVRSPQQYTDSAGRQLHQQPGQGRQVQLVNTSGSIWLP